MVFVNLPDRPEPGQRAKVFQEEDIGGEKVRRSVEVVYLGPGQGFAITQVFTEFKPMATATPVTRVGVRPGEGIIRRDFEEEKRVVEEVERGEKEGVVITPTKTVQAVRVSPEETQVITTQRRPQEPAKPEPQQELISAPKEAEGKLIEAPKQPKPGLERFVGLSPTGELLAPTVTRLPTRGGLPVRLAGAGLVFGEEFARRGLEFIPTTGVKISRAVGAAPDIGRDVFGITKAKLEAAAEEIERVAKLKPEELPPPPKPGVTRIDLGAVPRPKVTVKPGELPPPTPPILIKPGVGIPITPFKPTEPTAKPISLLPPPLPKLKELAKEIIEGEKITVVPGKAEFVRDEAARRRLAAVLLAQREAQKGIAAAVGATPAVTKAAVETAKGVGKEFGEFFEEAGRGLRRKFEETRLDEDIKIGLIKGEGVTGKITEAERIALEKPIRAVGGFVGETTVASLTLTGSLAAIGKGRAAVAAAVRRRKAVQEIKRLTTPTFFPSPTKPLLPRRPLRPTVARVQVGPIPAPKAAPELVEVLPEPVGIFGLQVTPTKQIIKPTVPSLAPKTLTESQRELSLVRERARIEALLREQAAERAKPVLGGGILEEVTERAVKKKLPPVGVAVPFAFIPKVSEPVSIGSPEKLEEMIAPIEKIRAPEREVTLTRVRRAILPSEEEIVIPAITPTVAPRVAEVVREKERVRPIQGVISPAVPPLPPPRAPTITKVPKAPFIRPTIKPPVRPQVKPFLLPKVKPTPKVVQRPISTTTERFIFRPNVAGILSGVEIKKAPPEETVFTGVEVRFPLARKSAKGGLFEPRKIKTFTKQRLVTTEKRDEGSKFEPSRLLRLKPRKAPKPRKDVKIGIPKRLIKDKEKLEEARRRSFKVSLF